MIGTIKTHLTVEFGSLTIIVNLNGLDTSEIIN